jgi:hypothetical protein
MLAAAIFYIGNASLFRQDDLIQKINQQIFVQFRTKQFFEPEIREWIDIFFLYDHKETFQTANLAFFYLSESVFLHQRA